MCAIVSVIMYACVYETYCEAVSVIDSIIVQININLISLVIVYGIVYVCV